MNRMIETLNQAVEFYASNIKLADEYLSTYDISLEDEVIKLFKIGFAQGDGSLIAYMENRGFSLEDLLKVRLIVFRNGKIVELFENSILFPFLNESGNVIRILGISIQSKIFNIPKFHFAGIASSPDYFNSYFGLYQAIQFISNKEFVISSDCYMGVLSAHKKGIKNIILIPEEDRTTLRLGNQYYPIMSSL